MIIIIELQVLNKILKEHSLSIIRQNNITEEYFITYRNEFEFILDHYQKYDTVPDKETFIEKFQDFDLIDVMETNKYLIEKLQEQFLYSKMVPFVHAIADKVVVNAQEAVQFAMVELEKINKLSLQYKLGYDIVKNAHDRKQEFKRRLEVEGLLGVTSGIKEMDNLTHGWLEEDLIIIVGRINEGKSWVTMFFLVMAWKLLKKPVLLYSGEMGKNMVGFRFDTINNNFSNEGLMSGLAHLGNEKTSEDYCIYLTELAKLEIPFIVITPKDLGGKKLTVPMLHNLIELYNPCLVGIDQISLMDDYRASRGEQQRIRYTHISEDLYITSEKYGIPIIAPAQANREPAKKKKGEDEEGHTPELHEIMESDGIGASATRVISIKQMGNTMKLAIKKNRYGKNNQEIMLLWNLDMGIVKPFLQVSTDKNGKTEEVKKLMEGEDLF